MASRWGGSQRGPLLTISVGKTGCSSVGDFLRVILKASGPLPLLQPLWPLFLLLQLPSKGDPLCVLRSVVLGGRLGDGGGWLEVIAGISPLLGPARLRRLLSSGLLWMREHSLPASASSASVTAVQSVLPESPFFPFFRKVPRRFCPSTGQDPAGVSNAGPNPRHQTSALGWQTGPVFSDPRIQPLLHELFRSVGILCIFFMNTCFK